MAGNTRFLSIDFLALTGLAGRNGRCLQLLLSPGVKLSRGLDDHPDAHPGVLSTAIFGAGAQVGTGGVGLKPEMVGTAGNGVHFPAQLRHPKTMNNVGGINLGQHFLPGGQVNLIGRDQARLGVAYFPPPLMPGNHYVGLGRGGSGGVGQAHGIEGQHCQHRQQNGGRGRPGNFQIPVSKHLSGFVIAGPAAVAE